MRILHRDTERGAAICQELERNENDQKDEKIIDAERKFDQIPGGKLQASRTSVPEINQHAESERQTDPHRAPAQRLAKADTVRPAVEYAQIEHQHHNYKQVEEHPEKDQ